jgi:hypothetical protein
MLKRILTGLFLAIQFLAMPACDPLGNSVSSFGNVFKGNTKRDPHDYDLDVRRDYRQYRNYRKIEEKQEEDEVLRRLNDDEKNSKVRKK